MRESDLYEPIKPAAIEEDVGYIYIPIYIPYSPLSNMHCFYASNEPTVEQILKETKETLKECLREWTRKEVEKAADYIINGPRV